MHFVVAGNGGCTGRIRQDLMKRGHQVTWVAAFVEIRNDGSVLARVRCGTKRKLADLSLRNFDAAFLGPGLEGKIQALVIMRYFKKVGLKTCAMETCEAGNRDLRKKGAVVSCVRGFVVRQMDMILPSLTRRIQP